MSETSEPEVAVMNDPLRGKYIRTAPFKQDFIVARERLKPLGGLLEAGQHDYQAFTFTMPGLRLVFYPHKTTAGHYHTRVRAEGTADPKALREAIFALAENTCRFQFPSDRALHSEAVTLAIQRELAATRASASSRKHRGGL